MILTGIGGFEYLQTWPELTPKCSFPENFKFSSLILRALFLFLESGRYVLLMAEMGS